MKTLPTACRPNYNKHTFPGLTYFPTRRDIVYHFWFVLGINNFNIWKEGPFYTVRIDNILYATGWRNLFAFTKEHIEECVNRKYFPN